MKHALAMTIMTVASISMARPAAADPNQAMQQQLQMQQQQQAQQQQQLQMQLQQQQEQLQTQLQQQAQQQQQNQQFQNQSLGLSGVQPYCSSYGTCRDPFHDDAPSGPDLGTLLFGGLLGAGRQSAIYAEPPASYPAYPTTGRLHHRHRRRHVSR